MKQIIDVKHIEDTNYKQDLMRSHLEGKGQGPYSQQGSLFANPLAATLQSPCLLPYTGPIDLRVTLSLLMTSTVVN
ncbi:hypothetical protein DAPPUDRAFT_333784 [Daphnia pulex]|uniref:Uncharacterized protein n=1 Tax=Daphnia pulex TaxID=6669 RepID=E9HTU0_DAPPU|nr:hypothetical protein DAPPUDRAFT_333784 [Daphnia pulex]|eukprot:EFX64841.1 hypothetical protein DAPPUDRAFT_333784 [Daphnia pulex]